jgi:ketosteroid isomerase-like protein
VGTAAILAGAKADLADPVFNLAFTTTKAQVSASGDTGYTQGSFSINFTDPATKKPSTIQGYYLTIFKKQDGGSWKVVEDMATPAS